MMLILQELFLSRQVLLLSWTEHNIYYKLFKNWTENGIYFVSRLKDNAVYCVMERKEVPARGNILKNQLIELCGQRANQLGVPMCEFKTDNEADTKTETSAKTRTVFLCVTE